MHGSAATRYPQRKAPQGIFSVLPGCRQKTSKFGIQEVLPYDEDDVISEHLCPETNRLAASSSGRRRFCRRRDDAEILCSVCLLTGVPPPAASERLRQSFRHKSLFGLTLETQFGCRCQRACRIWHKVCFDPAAQMAGTWTALSIPTDTVQSLCPTGRRLPRLPIQSPEFGGTPQPFSCLTTIYAYTNGTFRCGARACSEALSGAGLRGGNPGSDKSQTSLPLIATVPAFSALMGRLLKKEGLAPQQIVI